MRRNVSMARYAANERLLNVLPNFGVSNLNLTRYEVMGCDSTTLAHCIFVLLEFSTGLVSSRLKVLKEQAQGLRVQRLGSLAPIDLILRYTV